MDEQRSVPNQDRETQSETHDRQLSTDSHRAKPFEQPRKNTATEQEGQENSDETESTENQQTFENVNWELRETGNHYPTKKPYHCNDCLDTHFNQVSDLKNHITQTHDESWEHYVQKTGMHRCVGCGKPNGDISALYCHACTSNAADRLPCRNCGEVRVQINDPFCSPQCAAEYMQETTGGNPLEPPDSVTEAWLDHPHRLRSGIPTAAPFIGNHTLTCRECYEYGDDSIHSVAVHVTEKHPELGWDGYINKYELRRCRVCESGLYSLLPLYCSPECKQSDPHPPRTCENNECTHAVERRQKYCSHDCYITDRFKTEDED